jgi:hypothetical protein
MKESVDDRIDGAPSPSTAAQREARPVVIAEPAMGMGLLIASGMFLGGTIGAVLLFVLQFGAPGGIHLWVDIPFALVIGGGFGGIVGALTAPLLGATILRHVPYGLAMLVTSVGTIAGAALGVIVGSPVKGGLAGYALTACALFLCFRHRRTAG